MSDGFAWLESDPVIGGSNALIPPGEFLPPGASPGGTLIIVTPKWQKLAYGYSTEDDAFYWSPDGRTYTRNVLGEWRRDEPSRSVPVGRVAVELGAMIFEEEKEKP